MSTEILDPVAEAEEASPDRRRFRKIGWVGWVSVAIIVLALLVAVLGPIVRPFDPNTGDLSFANVGPYGTHLLGFDGQGRDVLSRLLEGARTTIFGAASVALIAVLVGTSLALATAWFGGKFDASVSAGLDVLFAFPGILLWLSSLPAVFASSRASTPPHWPWRSPTRRMSRGCATARR